MSALYDKKKCPLCGGTVALKKKGRSPSIGWILSRARHNGFLGMYRLRN